MSAQLFSFFGARLKTSSAAGRNRYKNVRLPNCITTPFRGDGINAAASAFIIRYISRICVPAAHTVGLSRGKFAFSENGGGQSAAEGFFMLSSTASSSSLSVITGKMRQSAEVESSVGKSKCSQIFFRRAAEFSPPESPIE